MNEERKEIELVECPQCKFMVMPEGNRYCSNNCYLRAVSEGKEGAEDWKKR